MSRFFVVDVFANTALAGNPVMVVLPDSPLTTSRMQAFAAWNGMPETVFLSDASSPLHRDAYAARIFSPRSELAFAGHPSLGAAHVAVQCGLAAGLPYAMEPNSLQGLAGDLHRVWQECGAGKVELLVNPCHARGAFVFVKTPQPALASDLSAETVQLVLKAVGLDSAPQEASPAQAFKIDTGACWLVVRVGSILALADLKPNMPEIESLSGALGVSGVTVYAPAAEVEGHAEPVRLEVRSFGPAIGVPEDAVCGGGNACVAAMEHHLNGLAQAGGPIQGYQTRQGSFVGRDGRVGLLGPVDDARFWLGGRTDTVMSGTLDLRFVG